jgi:hypothetical protein
MLWQRVGTARSSTQMHAAFWITSCGIPPGASNVGARNMLVALVFKLEQAQDLRALSQDEILL